MEQSHNIYGKAEFNLAPLKVQAARLEYPSGLVIPETKKYRDKIKILLNQNYRVMLGVAYALETHADFMLSNLREIFSLSRTVMDKIEYKKLVEVYFNVHLDNDIELRHSEDSKQCILNNCTSAEALADIIYGIDETCKIQQAMWSAMHLKAMQIVSPVQSKCVSL
jgi:hypothetical protein